MITGEKPSKKREAAQSKDDQVKKKSTTKKENKTVDELNARKESVKNAEELSPEELAIERMLLKEQQRQKLLDALAPEELVDKALLGEGQEAGGWRRRKVRQKGLPAKAADESSDANSDMPGQ